MLCSETIQSIVTLQYTPSHYLNQELKIFFPYPEEQRHRIGSENDVINPGRVIPFENIVFPAFLSGHESGPPFSLWFI